jgi:transposase InsO family protein
MPWKDVTAMNQRREFVLLAQHDATNVRQLCQQFGISAKTGYKWLERYRALGEAGLADRSRRPHCSPRRSSESLEHAVLALHRRYPCWGARKLHALLPIPDEDKPHPSTIAAILTRYGQQVESGRSPGSAATRRFEHEAPNQLWQMDFKGHFPLTQAAHGRCHPLTVLDDHSRFSLCLQACGDERAVTVQRELARTFARYGLPERISCDNGPSWRSARLIGLTALEVWLIRLGIRIGHSRPYHPQTQGKDERFHRTLKCELLDRYGFSSLPDCQQAFDRWRDRYNLIRPHEALGQRPPISRYRPSARSLPAILPPVEYDSGEHVLKVLAKGQIHHKRVKLFVGEGLAGQYVAIRPTANEHLREVYFCHHKVRTIDLRQAE